MHGEMALALSYALAFAAQVEDNAERAKGLENIEWLENFLFEGNPGLYSFMSRPKDDASEVEILSWIHSTVDELRELPPWFATQVFYHVVMYEELNAEFFAPVDGEEDDATIVTKLSTDDGELVREVMTLGHPHLDTDAALIAAGIAEVEPKGDTSSGRLPLIPRIALV